MGRLSAVQVKSAKPQQKNYKLIDGHGLHLLIQASGGKLWRYDFGFAGKRKTLAIGGYPAINLAVARVRHQKAKENFASGITHPVPPVPQVFSRHEME
ncbi:MAG: hypothetical protein RI942_1291 [Pseudomonadota bacterium]|jgi:hypothetical protein